MTESKTFTCCDVPVSYQETEAEAAAREAKLAAEYATFKNTQTGEVRSVPLEAADRFTDSRDPNIWVRM